TLPKSDIARRGPSADESSALPRLGVRFIVRDGGVDGEGNRRDLGRRTKPEVDSLDITILGALLQQFDHAATDSNGGLAGVVAFAPRQFCWIEQEQQIHVG